MTESVASSRIDRWKVSLLDLTLRNRLLDARDSKQTLSLALPEPADLSALWTTLEQGAELRIEPFRAPTLEPGRAEEAVAKAARDALAEGKLLTTLSAAELDRRLVTIARAAAANLADAGVHTLWLGVGLLEWHEDDAAPDRVRSAPLVLWPVELTRSGAGQRYKLCLSDEEPRLNATLFEKLRVEFGIALPSAEKVAPAEGAQGEPEEEERSLPSLMARLAQAVAHKPSWRVVPGGRLGVFSFSKFVMWTDLSGRTERLLESPLVAHLAQGRGEAFGGGGEFPDVDELDAQVPVGSLLTPLDADGSQLAAVKAAASGQTFVLQGPPGTGKSQTITNLICHCLSEGKSVLFVSEKMAALEVVHRRLQNAGLGDFCLELHSHKAKRKEVIEKLGRVLERSWRPGSPAPAEDGRLAKLRQALDDYATALHAPGALGESLHQVLGRLVELRAAPKLPALAGSLEGLDQEQWRRRRDAVAALAAAAEALGDPATHPWRSSRLSQWAPSSAEALERSLSEALAAAQAMQQAVASVVERVPGLRAGSAKELAALGALAAVAATSPRPAAELVDAVAQRLDDAPPVGEVASKIAAVKARARGEAHPEGGASEEPRALLPVRRPVPRPTEPGKYLELARRHRALAAEVEARFSPSIDTVDVAALAATFRAWAGRFVLWRFFALRNAKAQVRGVWTGGALPAESAVADELDKVAGERALRAALEAARSEAEKWFAVRDPLASGTLDFDKQEASLGWARELATAFAACAVAEGSARAGVWRALLAQVAATGDGAASLELAPFDELAKASTRWQAAERELLERAGLPALADGADHLAAVEARCLELAPSIGKLRDHVAFVRAIDEAKAAGATEVAPALEAGVVSAAQALEAWERAVLLAHCDALIAAAPALREFHGSTHHANIAEFVELDRATLVLAKARAIARLAERVPKISADAGGEVGVLLHELKKQRRHKPLRELFRLLPTLLPRLRPCLLMSPLSVAQYLDPALPRFDLVVFDEASQIPTADAIGALARGERAVIVGDSRQLPPTRFFEVGGDSSEVDSTTAAGDDDEYEELESVLDESVAARVPQLYLRWHYRSRHEDLISFSNQRYYDERLFVFPAAAGRAGELGVSLRKIEGVYDRAGTRTNRAEAEAVVAEVVSRLRDPVAQKRSLGVVTFSKAQQSLVEDLLDEALLAEPELEPFFSSAVAEPVLVKNLETVQGDERDVMLFCIGYGPDASGKVAMNFGPLNRDGGERRLNVAITRAREQLVVFTSLEPEQISDSVSAAGVRHLAEFLAYARRGGGSALPPPDARASTPITESLARELEARGHKLVHGVGCAGYRIDLAVVDPDDDRRYVLAIETDGPSYNSSKVARDRDRLRGQVLAQLGWRTHRVWALDFWSDPEKEIARAQGAIIAAIAAGRQRRQSVSGANAQPGVPAAKAPGAPSGEVRSAGSAPSAAVVGGGAASPSAAVTRPVAAARAREASRPSAAVTSPVERRDGSGPAGKAESLGIVPYTNANVPSGRRTADDLFSKKHLGEIAKVAEQVLLAEAPMRISLLVRRVAAYFGIARVTDKVVAQVREHLGSAVKWGQEPDVVWHPAQDPKVAPAVRAQSGTPESKRDIEDVPLVELAEAARRVVERAVGISQPELARELARLLGYGRATERVLERIAEGVEWARANGVVAIESERVTLP